MRLVTQLVLIVALLSQVSQAETTNWCDVSAFGADTVLVYPPIGKAAHVSGLVISRLRFSPLGQTLGLDVVSGPVLLAKSLSQQAKTWTVGTSTLGTGTCQTLLLVDFTLGDEKPHMSSSPAPAGMAKLTVHGEPIIIYDLAPVLCRRVLHFWQRCS